MNTQELEGLLNELLQGINQVMQSGEVLSDEFQGVLAETLNNLINRIDIKYNKRDKLKYSYVYEESFGINYDTV